MQKVVIEALIQNRSTQHVFDVVSDFARYPELVDTVRSVHIHEDSDDRRADSDWEVYFRNGVLAWTESDVFDRSALTISFEQTEGDFDVFSGSWSMSEREDGTHLSFTAGFDFGVPSLASIIDPVAVRVLTETMETILLGLFDGQVTFDHSSSLDRAHALSEVR